MYRIFITLLLVSCSSVLAACNTMEGMGKDIKTGGEKLEKAAENNKEENKK